MFAEGEVKTTWKKVKLLTSGEFVMKISRFLCGGTTEWHNHIDNRQCCARCEK